MLHVGVGSQSSLLTLTSQTMPDLTEALSCLVFSWQAAQELPFPHGDPLQVLHFSDEEFDGLLR